MESEEVSYSEKIICPYCKSILVDNEDLENYKICSHTIFIATDYGFEFIREDFKDTFDNESKGVDYGAYTNNSDIKGVRIVQFTPPPSFFGVYWGFVED